VSKEGMGWGRNRRGEKGRGGEARGEGGQEKGEREGEISPHGHF